jgi:predicted DNA-binding protein (UPF0251 family)
MERSFDVVKAAYENARQHAQDSDRARIRWRKQVLKSLPRELELNSVDELVLELLPLASAELRKAFSGINQVSIPDAQASKLRSRKKGQNAGIRYDENVQQRLLYAHDVEGIRNIAELQRRFGMSRATVLRGLEKARKKQGASADVSETISNGARGVSELSAD